MGRNVQLSERHRGRSPQPIFRIRLWLLPMSRPDRTSGIFLIVAAAAVGILLVFVPPKVLDQYEKIKQLGPPWIYFYLALVGTGLAILVTLTCMIGVKL